MKFSEMFLVDFDQEMESTRKLLSAVPEKITDYKPHPKSMAMDKLAGHVAEMPDWAKFTMEMEVLDFDMKTFVPFLPKTRAELLEAFDKNVKGARSAITGASDEAMATIWTLKINGQTAFALPRSQMLRSFVLNHIIHHRAQLGVYLRLLDVAIPGMYGPSADDTAQMSAAK